MMPSGASEHSARLSTGVARIEQAMQMDDEIAHLGIVDGLLRSRFPCRIGGRVVGVDADDVELVEVFEFDIVERRELAAEDEMQQLLGLPRHGSSFASTRQGLNRR